MLPRRLLLFARRFLLNYREYGGHKGVFGHLYKARLPLLQNGS